MRAARAALVLAGVACGVVGVIYLLGLDPSTWTSVLLWLAGGVILHDAILAPLTVGLGIVAARLLPRTALGPVVVGWIVWATVTAAVANVLLPVGGKPDNDTLMNRPYLVWWLVLGAVWWIAVAVVATVRARRVNART